MLTVEKHSSGSYLPLQCMFMLVQFIQLSSGCSSWNMMSLIPSPLPFVTFVLHGKDRSDIIYAMHPSNIEDPRPKPRISCWYSDHWLTSLPRRLAFNWWIMNEAGWTFFIIAIIVISICYIFTLLPIQLLSQIDCLFSTSNRGNQIALATLIYKWV